MSEAPLLSRDDVIEEVRTLHQRRHRSLSTALRGRGEGGEVTIPVGDGSVRFLVEAVDCELALRRALWREEGTPKILLVENVPALPHDLHGRLAGGEIREVTEARRLARLFGATAVSPLLATSAVGRALLEQPQVRPAPIQGSTVDLETGLRALLWARAGLPTDGALSEERLLAFFATNPLPAPFAAQLGASNAAPELDAALAGHALRAAIAEYLGERHGLSAALAFAAWCRGKGERAAALIFVLETVAVRLPGNGYLRARLVGLLQSLDPLAPGTTLERLAGQADHLKSLATRLHLRLGQDEANRGALISVLAEADRLLPEAEALKELDESLFLPGSLERGLGRLGQQLGAVLDAPAGAAVAAMQRCKQTLEQLSRHVLASEPSRRERLERARMAARLVAWLASGEPDARGVEARGDTLATEGGLVDRAIRGAAGLPEGPLRAVVERVRSAAIARRETMNKAFADGLAAASGSPVDGQLLPEHVLDRVVIPFLAGRPARRLLLVLVPGFHWPDAHELLETLERDTQPGQAMLAFRGSADAGVGGAASGGLGGAVPAESALPLPPLLGGNSMGEIRSRLLAGRVAPPGQILDEPRDEQRFRTHEGLRAVSGAEEPLYLASHGALLPDGGQTTNLVARIASPRRLVAAGLPVPKEGLQRGVILDLLRQASEAGRATLLVSCGGAGPDDREGESVLPLLLLGSDWLENLAEGKDAELQLLPPPRPQFWQLEVPQRTTVAKPPSRPPSRPARTKAPNPNQMALLDLPAAPLPLRPRLQKVFATSTGTLTKQVLDVVEALYEAGGTMSEEDLARKMNLFGPRVAGLVARASEMVSKDGYELLSFDHHARMAKLNKQLLNQFLEGVTV